MSKSVNVDEIIRLAEEGKTVKEIAKEANCSEVSVRKYIKELNIPVYSKKTKKTPELLEQISKMVDDGMTNQQIADALKMALPTVRNWIQDTLKKETNSLRTKRITDKEIKFSDEQLEVLYGALLGDATIGINWKNARIAFNHGGDQEAYFDHKCEIFKEFLGKVNKTPRFDKRTNKYYNRYAVRLLAHPFVTELYHKFYPDGIKTVTQEWLDLLTPRSLAFWFMDDGNQTGVLATNSFSYEECKLIQKYFKDKWGMNITIHNQKTNHGPQYTVYFTAQAKPIFYELVKPYIIPSMEYKFKNWNP